ncbi:PREDICTED: putative selection and upkeep of intraepithelial T-cells protein 1 homolog [Galeopterus variegatus]|uniref:Selection and upkeep of intraepithelial T-cells protein 1 homolog n=1 Tax=Galeopterus variegatus TaxID=482537 RepID=A0ABM0QDJ5_GALVR|nr:PREDICTED: putative selection and upkeep of intraepithelial T-cells protein 1 homolog [Galeopterus variegatus]
MTGCRRRGQSLAPGLRTAGWACDSGSMLGCGRKEKLKVTIPKGHLVAIVGGQAELICQLFPQQSAEHMEVRWFKGDHSKPIHLYRGVHEVNEETAPEYADRTEFVKEVIREGKVTLRIYNISISDEGSYHCSFKDNGFSDVASMNLSVAALGLETQILVQAPSTDGLTVGCNSRGWFPQPQMEWRDSRGEVVPYSSKLSTQDGARLFHVEMTLLLRKYSQSNITCYICNPLTGEGKQISIILADDLFTSHHIWMTSLISILCIMFLLPVGYTCFLSFTIKERTSRCRVLKSSAAQLLCYMFCCGVVLAVYVPFRSRGASVKRPRYRPTQPLQELSEAKTNYSRLSRIFKFDDFYLRSAISFK